MKVKKKLEELYSAAVIVGGVITQHISFSLQEVIHLYNL